MSEKTAFWIKFILVTILGIGCIVVDSIQCVADTKKNIEIIKNDGKVPVEVYNEK